MTIADAARLRITLLDLDPAPWREVDVPLSMTLKGLHETIQGAFLWFDCHLDYIRLDIVFVEWLSVPFREIVVFFMAWICHGMKEHFEAGCAADIFGRRASFSIDEDGQSSAFWYFEQFQDFDMVLPIVAHVVSIEEFSDAAVAQFGQPCCSSVVDLLEAEVVVMGQAIAPVVDIEFPKAHMNRLANMRRPKK